MTGRTLRRDIAAVLADAGLADTVLRLEPCVGGRNNRVYRVTTPTGDFLAKQYFKHPMDNRDRLTAEYAFLQVAEAAGLRCVPKPIARCDRAALALYEYIEGRALTPDELASEHVDQARDFVLALNGHGTRRLAASLPPASEARFSVSEQLALVQRRVDALAQVAAAPAIDAAVRTLASRIREQWTTVREGVLTDTRLARLEPSAVLAPEDLCVSPSDFGFHNALLTPDGTLRFLDFEYAGWDDPAKMVSDFFAQPGVPVPIAHYERFLAETLAFSPNAERLAVRARLLLPVFRVKWSCIMMNEYLPNARLRRRFASRTADDTGQQRAHLDRALQVFGLIQ